MQEYTEEQFLEKYNSLPQELKTAMSSIESSEIIQAIGKKYGLHIDQTGELASETGFVLLGFTKPEDYIRNLKDRLKVDPQKAKEIALEINSRIFSKVKENLKRLHGIGSEEKKENVFNKTKNSDIAHQNLEIAPKTKDALPQEQTKTQSSSPLELIKKHESDTIKNSENKEELKKTEDTQNPPVSLLMRKMPDEKDAPAQELKNQISRYAKQTTEIKFPDENKKNIPPKTGHYPEGDPYKEPI